MNNLFKVSLLSLSLVFSVPTVRADNAVHTTQTIKTQDRLSLFLQKDMPVGKPKAVLVISHGLASHSGVFGDMAKTMNDNGIAVYRFDHRGHGKSDGRDSIHIKSYFEMVEDLRLVVEKAKRENPNTPVFVLGHSMGGHISALYGTKYPQGADGFILAAGVLRYHQMNFGYLPRPEPKDSFVSGSVALTTLNLPMPKSDESGLSLPNDPLMLEKFSVSFANSFKEGLEYLKDNGRKFTAPVMLISGNDDLYVVPQDAIDFYNETNSADKSLVLYPNFGHLLMLEKGGQKINDDVAEWIGERVK
ncbi:alpha/beta hydrolase [Neisseria chenwenguii]|uniref:Alpha/beta hydrolase n=1 Tax=Neisseria chenwenguii TaxID=1853278 RepID=A0A220RZN0_9NEIS|nr:alpha/beta hydrolase [Neisseria chenwenguii]ASK26647.1 alpha/beta hydrolase [Neisseria chenwenguii]